MQTPVLRFFCRSVRPRGPAQRLALRSRVRARSHRATRCRTCAFTGIPMFPKSWWGRKRARLTCCFAPVRPPTPAGDSRNAWRRSTYGKAVFCAPGSSEPRAAPIAARSCCDATSRRAGRIRVRGALLRKRVGAVHRGPRTGRGSGVLSQS